MIVNSAVVGNISVLIYLAGCLADIKQNFIFCSVELGVYGLLCMSIVLL